MKLSKGVKEGHTLDSNSVSILSRPGTSVLCFLLPSPPLQVCAPSNSALDEIVLRVMKSGLMDKDGNM